MGERLMEDVQLTDEEDIYRLMRMFIFNQGTRRLKENMFHLSKKEGPSVEYIGIYFKDDIDGWDDPEEILDEHHAVLWGSAPAVQEDCIAILNFQELCYYVEKAVHEEIVKTKQLLNTRPELTKPPYNYTLLNEEELLVAIAEMKKGLGVK